MLIFQGVAGKQIKSKPPGNDHISHFWEKELSRVIPGTPNDGTLW